MYRLAGMSSEISIECRSILVVKLIPNAQTYLISYAVRQSSIMSKALIMTRMIIDRISTILHRHTIPLVHLKISLARLRDRRPLTLPVPSHDHVLITTPNV
jgi:hypothetical protein